MSDEHRCEHGYGIGEGPCPTCDGPADAMIAYLVTDIYDDGYVVKRLYLDRAEADGFVDAYRAVSGGVEVEEIVIGAPDVEYDGPVWVGIWSTRRKLVGERQLVIVTTDGFTMVIPSVVPSKGYSIQDVLALKAGPGWRDLAAPEYEEPPVWIDNFRYYQEWHTGDNPSRALIRSRSKNRVIGCQVEVSGTSKDAVEQLLLDTARHIKADR